MGVSYDSTIFIDAAVHQVYTRYTRALDLTPKECIQNLELATRLVDGRRRPEPVNPA